MAVAEPYLAPSPFGAFRGAALRARARNAFAGTTPGAYIALGSVALILLITIFAPILAPHEPTLPVGQPLSAPSGSHLLGTDEIGRDILSRVLYGMRSSWWGAMVVILSGVLIGGLVGLVAGAAGGIVDGLFMRVTDVFLAMPGAVLAIAVVAAMGPSYTNTLFAISIVWWPLYARIMRGEVRRLRASPHVEAARLAGAGRIRLAVRHLLPGATPSMLVTASLDVSALVLSLAGLSFLGLGAPAPAPELGAMTARGVTYLFSAWWVPIMPATAVFLLALVANFGGDALRDRMRDR
jgi:peptide/nickel transport system permease protein